MTTAGVRPAGYTSTTGFRTTTLPWRLYQKGKQLAWDPAELDFTQDAAEWAELDPVPRRLIARLATIFMAGEESVTLDIVPLLRAVADLGRVEEAMFLTTFVSDEAKHAELFRRWFDAVGYDEPLGDMLPDSYKRIFDVEQPRVMRRLDTDHSPEAILDAALTYNQFVEGVLAMTGYWAWHRIFTMRGVLPGMRRGLELVQRDERRHIAYGTYLCRRIVAERPELWSFVEKRMAELEQLGMTFVADLGQTIIGELAALRAEQEAKGLPTETPMLAGADVGEGASFSDVATAVLMEFTQYGQTQLGRRLKVIEVATKSTVSDVEEGSVEEDLEADLEQQ